MGSQDTQRGCDCSCAWHGKDQPCGCPCPDHPDEPALGTSEARLAEAKEALERAVYLAEHLWEMIPREVWRDSGGDDGQGHYEGDYRAEQVRTELQSLAALSGDDTPAEQDPET